MLTPELKEKLSLEIYELFVKDERFNDSIDVWDALGILESVKHEILYHLDKNNPMWDRSFIRKNK